MTWFPTRRFQILDLFWNDFTEIIDEPWKSTPQMPKYSGLATKVKIKLKNGEELLAYCCHDFTDKFIECSTRLYIPMEDVDKWNYLKKGE